MESISPHKVRFTQSSVSYRFRDGRTIDDLASSLRTGTVSPEVVSPIRIFHRNGVYYTLDNRRLEAFRRAGMEVPYRLATAEEVESERWKFTTTNEGVSIRVRGEGDERPIQPRPDASA